MAADPASFTDRQVLSDELLATIRGRAAIHDRENSFFTEDLADLAATGYLRAMVPADLGGHGLTLRETIREQARLAGAAPATALAVNMHHVWVGVARYLHERGDGSLDWLLAEAARGEVFGFGYSEAGNDLVLLGSRTEARPDGEGGYRFHGRKIFTSNSPGWTRLGVMGLDDTDPDDPRIVHAFITRDGGGFQILDDWDTLGMRASQSCTTVLDGAHAPADRVMRRLVPGPGLDPYVLGIFTSFELLLAGVYTGIADRALHLAVEAAGRRTSMKTGKAYSQDPDIRWRIASAALALDGIWPQLDQVAGEIDALVDRGAGYFRATAGLKVRATETARYVVDEAIRCSGGSTYFNRSELGRLYRDVLAGIFHPSDDESAHAQVAQSLLGPVDAG
ncbi:alkylation response protein AidB-like acyl-CoA dehydrogenase [Isoptericola sp. CG 20/1183]|uniref:Alkylation response protein AidB-like acyl-CoA dehydrogenase n=1 Tax=Isoptericola halotolerans TaxID=300560 RepID=A0ABX5EGA5_9MICO|nr:MULTISPECIES: acyl-CoA dehydrogenase family protein [Isoptericola]PRZ05166.1 alkylation response protein AidB-like acyl-CoA dehydrogenase [Isoptericola halotolerans]PRZ05904.1 alkylation response protein AidB-like acyl-CoA dehydrogenase [Isoptericola sp. CG 20/1183]